MFDTTDWETSLESANPIAAIRTSLAEVSTEDRSEWTSDALSEELVELMQLRDRVDAEVTRVAGAWHRKRGWEADGALSPVAWLTHRTPIGDRGAKQLVKTAKLVDMSPRLAEALATGAVTAAHVEALARVMSARRRPLLAEHEDVLARHAERLSIRDFTTVARRWAAIADDHLAKSNHDEYQPRNELHASVTMDGWLDGMFRLDPISGSGVLATLDHLAPPDPANAPDGVRSLAQRRGDALVELSKWYHQGAKPGGNPPNIDVVVDVASLNGEPPDLTKARCDLQGIGPVTQATLEQIACGATLTRFVMAGRSVILDMGRKTRLATPSQTKAIRLRDRGCIFPSCDRPARWCDIHHVDEFAKGGVSDVARMACLCTRHHTLIHNSKWTIHINPDGTFTARHPARAP